MWVTSHFNLVKLNSLEIYVCHLNLKELLIDCNSIMMDRLQFRPFLLNLRSFISSSNFVLFLGVISLLCHRGISNMFDPKVKPIRLKSTSIGHRVQNAKKGPGLHNHIDWLTLVKLVTISHSSAVLIFVVFFFSCPLTK